MTQKLIQKVEEKYKQKSLDLKPGMLVRVYYKVKGRTALKPFTGIVIRIKNKNSLSGTFTVRGEAAGQDIEKTYPLYSPNLSKVEILKQYKVRRAKLYFLRKMSKLTIARKLKPIKRTS